MRQKKVIWFCVVAGLFLLVTSSTVESMIQTEQESPVEPLVVQRTFIAGTIFGAEKVNGTVSATVLSLIYVERGFLIEDIGLIRPFTDIRFTPTIFLYRYSPGPFGFVEYVFGICSDFEIID